MITGHAPEFKTEVGRLIGEHANLMAYKERVLAAYFADFTGT